MSPFPQSKWIECPPSHRLLLHEAISCSYFLVIPTPCLRVLQEQVLPLPVPHARGPPQRARGWVLGTCDLVFGTCDLVFGTCGTFDLVFGSWGLDSPNPLLVLSRLKAGIVRRCYFAADDGAVAVPPPPPNVVVALVARLYLS